MHIEIDDWWGALAFIVVTGLFLFFLMYWAARLAALTSPSLPKFSCHTETDGGSTRFSLTNIGSGPAFDVAIRWARDEYGDPFARTPMLGPQGICTWELSPVTPGSLSLGGPASHQVVEWLSVEWRPNQAGSGRWTRVPVRIPGGLIER
jgi:hypothetical protein